MDKRFKESFKESLLQNKLTPVDHKTQETGDQTKWLERNGGLKRSSLT